MKNIISSQLDRKLVEYLFSQPYGNLLALQLGLHYFNEEDIHCTGPYALGCIDALQSLDRGIELLLTDSCNIGLTQDVITKNLCLRNLRKVTKNAIREFEYFIRSHKQPLGRQVTLFTEDTYNLALVA